MMTTKSDDESNDEKTEVEMYVVGHGEMPTQLCCRE